jgi:hypothetical protein
LEKAKTKWAMVFELAIGLILMAGEEKRWTNPIPLNPQRNDDVNLP